MRILVWNIQNFTLKRLNDTTSGNTSAEKAAVSEGNLANLLYILSTVEQTDADVFVVLEALCEAGEVGALVSGDGAQGLVYLLSQLREFNGEQWSLVPPLRVNSIIRRIETVGVFYRTDRVTFLGPNARQAPYPAPWNDCVPQNTTAAAQCIFYPPNSRNEITFPEAKNRRPYLTSFYEISTGRTVKLFSAHTQPGVNARRAMSSMLDIPNWVPGNLEATVFAGDFNVDLFDPNTLESEVLRDFRNAGLTRLPFPQEPRLPRSVYVARKYAEPTVGVGDRIYDQRGTKGRVSYLKPELLDYGFVRYGQNATPNAYGAQMVDRVAGVDAVGIQPAVTTDMGWSLPRIQQIQDLIPTLAPPPNGAKRVNGVTTYTTTTPHGFEPGDHVHITGQVVGTHIIGLDDLSFWMQGPVQKVLSPTKFTMSQPGEPDATSGDGQAAFYYRNQVFRQRWNYWHIGPPVADSGTGTSDHLPVLMIV